MIAVDTNVLVYAHRAELDEHDAARETVTELAQGPAAWALPVFVISEFLRVATHPRVLDPPSPERDALAAVDALLASPSLRVLSPGERYWEVLRELVRASGARGNLIHDAAIAATCLEAGVSTLLTEDRAFERFPGLSLHRLER